MSEFLRDLDAEEAALGAAIAHYDVLSEVCERAEPDWFGFNENALIFRALTYLYENSSGQDIEMKMVVDRMRATQTLSPAGGAEKVAHVANSACRPSQVDYNIGRVEDLRRRRLILKMGSDMERASDESVDLGELMTSAEEAFYTLSSDDVGGARDVASLLSDVMTEAEVNAKREEPLLGVSSGLSSLDDMTCGFQRGDLTVLAARPSMGKTSLALKVARTVANDQAVVFFSLEMSARALITRILSMQTHIDGRRIRRGRLSESEWTVITDGTKVLSDAKLHIDDRSGISPTAARLKIQKLQKREPVGLVVVDYLQLMTVAGKQDSRVNEVTKVSQGLKAIAKDCDVPVVALSQLSRAPDHGGTHRRPILADLRDSGSIEQDADIVMFLFHPWKVKEQDAERGKCECIIAKQRNGPTGTVPLFWDEPYARFDNWTEGH